MSLSCLELETVSLLELGTSFSRPSWSSSVGGGEWKLLCPINLNDIYYLISFFKFQILQIIATIFNLTMTNGPTMISSGTTFVNPSAAPTTTNPTNSSVGGGGGVTSDPGKHEALEDVVLMNEEERILPVHDEEITSEEDGVDVDDDEGGTNSAASKMERKILTVALVKSVVDGGKAPAAPAPPTAPLVVASTTTTTTPAFIAGTSLSTTSSDGGGSHVVDTTSVAPGGPESPRYGLRKRRRPAGADLKRLEHNQATNSGGLKRTNSNESKNLSAGAIQAIASPPITSIGGEPPESPSKKRTRSSRQQPPVSTAALSQPPVAAARSKRGQRVPAPSAVAMATTLPCASFVPNPLAFASPEPSSTVPTSTKTTKTADAAVSVSSSVPCPLLTVAAAPVTAAAVAPLPPAPVDAPAPAPMAIVSFASCTAFPQPLADDSAPFENSVGKRKVTIQESSTRNRCFSIDLDSVGLDLLPDETASGGRNRAYSFECFAFGINADEPLPPLGSGSNIGGAPVGPEHDVSVIVGRPRGDSIIFDPCSFQDGGIHEQNALERATGAIGNIIGTPSMDSLVPGVAMSGGPMLEHPGQPVLRHRDSAPITTAAVVPRAYSDDGPVPLDVQSGDGKLPPVSSYTATTTTTTMATTATTVTTTTTTTTALNSSSSLSLELLNKDGRIGIYLPDARRSRIARFHAKRASRVWRKRIKYDCRKKLADSRPRIKGRFVKRSDV